MLIKKIASNATELSNPSIKDKKRITHQSSRTAIVEYDLSVAKIWSYRFIPEAFKRHDGSGEKMEA